MNTHEDLAALAQCADGTLSESDATRVRMHLAECRSCMAAYTDAVRYRAAWLADSEAFRLDREFRQLALDPARGGASAPAPMRRRPQSWAVALGFAAAALAVSIALIRPGNPRPSLGFTLGPAVSAAGARASARGLILPGAEAYADQIRPELRSGQDGSSLVLELEVKAAVDEYEHGTRGPEAAARAVAALLAAGEIEAARDYSRECLRRYPKAVPLLVFSADAGYRANDLGGAEELLRRARKIAPRDPIVALDLGLLLRERGRNAEAAQLLAEVAGDRLAPLAARARRELAREP